MTDQPSLTSDAVITQGEDQVSTVVDGDTVLMNVANGQYYQLDKIGSRVWALIETPTAISAVCDTLTGEFDVDRATCETDVLGLLNRLLANDLVRVAAPAER
jgi:hypothetical protein